MRQFILITSSVFFLTRCLTRQIFSSIFDFLNSIVDDIKFTSREWSGCLVSMPRTGRQPSGVKWVFGVNAPNRVPAEWSEVGVWCQCSGLGASRVEWSGCLVSMPRTGCQPSEVEWVFGVNAPDWVSVEWSEVGVWCQCPGQGASRG